MKVISHSELKAMNEQQHQDFVLINVLDREAFNQHHIRTSINIPLSTSDFSKHVDLIAGGEDRSIILYCASAACDASSKAAEKLEQAGFTNVYDYEGGIEDWIEKAGDEQ